MLVAAPTIRNAPTRRIGQQTSCVLTSAIQQQQRRLANATAFFLLFVNRQSRRGVVRSFFFLSGKKNRDTVFSFQVDIIHTRSYSYRIIDRTKRI